MLQDLCDSQIPHPAHRHFQKVIHDWLTRKTSTVMQIVRQSLGIILGTNHFQFVHGSSRPLSVAPPYDENRRDVPRSQHLSTVQVCFVVTQKYEDELKIVIYEL